MPKRSYEQFSSPGMSLSKLNTTSISITDLPVDVICLVFKHLPLSEVLRNQALVCKAFYDAHLQHCRSSVKHLTLLGHYMLKRNRQSVAEPQNEAFRKQVLFEYARETNGKNCSSTPTINPSASHLKLVVGLEESAYAAIGTKFQSVTSLELLQPALERHYKPITAMINAWGGDSGEEKKKKKKVTGGGSNSTNQLTELKIFFNKEIYRPDGLRINRSNSSCCLAYLLAEALTPDKAPALRRLVIVPGNWRVTCQNRGNYNSYRGPLIAKIDLSQVAEVNAPGFDVIDLPEERWGHLSGLRELTIKKCSLTTEVFVKWTNASAAKVLSRLTGLTMTITYDGNEFQQVLPAGVNLANLCRLSLLNVDPSLTKVVQQVVIPMTTTTTTTTTTNSKSTGVEGVNDRLEELCVSWSVIGSSEIQAWNVKIDGPLLSSSVRFQALTTLHLVKSTLLHSAAEMSALSALFPNLTHLRLDHNHQADGPCYFRGDIYFRGENCPQCFQHVLEELRERNPGLNPNQQQQQQNYLDLETAADVQQLIASSTAPVCKAALVRRAVAAWPKLASITLQIDDFFCAATRSDWEANACRTGVSRLQYLYRCENLLLRKPLTGEPLQEEDLKWTVQEVPY